MTLDPLTPRQLEAFTFIASFTSQHRYGPSRREIATALKIDVKHAHKLVLALNAKGWIRVAPGVSRGIVIVAPALGRAA